MQKCQFCETRSTWKCDCGAIFFCQKHVQKHLTPDKKHLLTPIKNHITQEAQQKLKQDIDHRIILLQELESQVESQTTSLISQLKSLQQDCLNSISALKSSYLSLLSKQECSDSEASQIESILTTNLTLNTAGPLNLSQEILNFYTTPLFREKIQLKASIEESLKFLNEYWGLILQSHTKEITSVSVSPNKQLVLTTSDDSTVRVWDLGGKKQKNCLKGHKDRVNCGLFSSDQSIFVTGSDDCTVKVWELDDLNNSNTLKGHTKAVKCLAIRPDSQILVSGSADCTLRLWNLSTYECLKVLSGHSDSINSLIFLNISKSLASSSSDRSLKIWDLENFTLINSFTGHSKQINTIIANQESSILYSASNDHTIKSWKINNETFENLTFIGHNDGVLHIALTCGDQKLLSSSLDCSIKIWKIEGECEKSVEVGAVVWSFGVITGNFLVIGKDDLKLGVFNLNDETFECFPGHTKILDKIEIGTDGREIISRGKDGTARVWGLKSRKQEKIFNLKDSHELVSDIDEDIKRILE